MSFKVPKVISGYQIVVNILFQFMSLCSPKIKTSFYIWNEAGELTKVHKYFSIAKATKEQAEKSRNEGRMNEGWMDISECRVAFATENLLSKVCKQLLSNADLVREGEAGLSCWN